MSHPLFRIPVITGTIARRMLLNFRVDAGILRQILPAPFRPKLIQGAGMAGVCLIRLEHLRPLHIPAALGITMESAAHRFAVEWDVEGELHEGVYIPRRDTSSSLAALAGGRIFPGVHHRARFRVEETANHLRLSMKSRDDDTQLRVSAGTAEHLPASSVFSSLTAASDFFRRGSLGYSSTDVSGRYDGLELRSLSWKVEPLDVENLESSYFKNMHLFPADSIEFDCALLMRGIKHEWHGRQPLCAKSTGGAK